MNRIASPLASFILALALLMLLLSCASDEEKKAKHLARAKASIEKMLYREAVIELRNVIQLEPGNDAAHFELGETYLKLNQGVEAFRAFFRAASLNPDNLKAQQRVGQVFLMGRKTSEAREKAELILQKSPDHIGGLLLLSGVRIQERDPDAALETLRKAASLAPTHFDVQLSLGRVLLAKGALDEADQALSQASKLAPAAADPYVELSRVQAARGKWSEAESILLRMVEIAPPRFRSLTTLARFYEQQGKVEQAEKTFREAAEAAPAGEVGPLLELAGYHSRSGSYADALEAVQKARTLSPDDLDIAAALARLHLDYQHLPEAEAVVGEMLERNPFHLEATSLQGRISLLRKNFSDALERFEQVLRESPRNAEAYLGRARARLGKRETKLAERDLNRAVELEPGLWGARLLLADMALKTGQQEAARQQLAMVLAAVPQHPEALMLLGKLKTLERDLATAERIYESILEQHPAHAPAHTRLALVYSFSGRQERAKELLLKALALNPGQLDALVLLTDLRIADGEHEEALRQCQKTREELKDSAQAMAALAYLEGRVRLAQRLPELARQHFEEAIEKDPSQLPPYLAIARIHKGNRDEAQAIANYEKLIAENPGYVPAFVALGMLHEQMGNQDKAEALYRRALEIDPSSGPAANNLAWRVLEKDGPVDEALKYAMVAKERLPESPAVMDTLGWAYYLKGSYLLAVAELEESLARNPRNPMTRHRLGLAYHRSGRPEDARRVLEELLKIDPDFEKAEQARQVLAEIRISGKK